MWSDFWNTQNQKIVLNSQESMLRGIQSLNMHGLRSRMLSTGKRTMANGLFGFTGIRVPEDMKLFANVTDHI